MALTAQQRARLVEIANEKGLDVDQLVAEAESIVAERAAKKAAPAGVEPSTAKPPSPAAPANATSTESERPKLYQYHLPFVTVNEVRTKWLGLEAWSDEDGGGEVAAAFAAKQSSAPESATTTAPVALPAPTMLPPR